MGDTTFQLVQLFGSTNLLEIIGIKSIEEYRTCAEDPSLLRQTYLRKVVRCHPFASPHDLDAPEGRKELLIRGKKLYVMNDIYSLFTDSDYEVIQKSKNYVSKGILPDLVSLQYLKDNPFRGDERDYPIPEFEDIAAELKELYRERMKKIQVMQSTYQPPSKETEETNKDDDNP